MTFNEILQEFPIKHHASVFNAAGRVYVPYYRQAHLNAYWSKDTTSAKKSLKRLILT